MISLAEAMLRQQNTANNANADAELVAKITKQVMAQLGLK